MVRREDESDEQFARRVQVTIAAALNLVPTNYHYKDKLELIKRLQQR